MLLHPVHDYFSFLCLASRPTISIILQFLLCPSSRLIISTLNQCTFIPVVIHFISRVKASYASPPHTLPRINIPALDPSPSFLPSIIDTPPCAAAFSQLIFFYFLFFLTFYLLSSRRYALLFFLFHSPAVHSLLVFSSFLTIRVSPYRSLVL